MLFTVVGRKQKCGVTSKTGKPFSGTEVSVVYQDDSVEGLATMLVWVKESICPSEEIKLGYIYEVVLFGNNAAKFQCVNVEKQEDITA